MQLIGGSQCESNHRFDNLNRVDNNDNVYNIKYCMFSQQLNEE